MRKYLIFTFILAAWFLPSSSIAQGIIGDNVTADTTNGGSLPDYCTALSASGLEYTAVDGDIVDSIWIYSWSGAGDDVYVGIYWLNGTTDTTLVGSEYLIDVGTGHQFYGVDVNIELTAGRDYIVAVREASGASCGFTTRTYTAARSYNDGTPCTALPSTWDPWAGDNGSITLWAPVVNSGTGPVIRDGAVLRDGVVIE